MAIKADLIHGRGGGGHDRGLLSVSENEQLPRGWAGGFARSFTIQGSWSYLYMIGSGFAFALRPLLRGSGRDDVDAVSRRHLERFNAHPYLAGIALGVVARMESEDVDPQTIHRLKEAIQGSLGGLGDTLVWGAWRPATLLFALMVAAAGAPPWVPVLLFLGLYNAGHVALRWWGFKMGLDEGRDVATRLGRAELPRLAERVLAAATLLLGLLVGVLLVGKLPNVGMQWFWSLGGGVSFVIGLRFGRPVLRAATMALILTIIVVSAMGGI